MKKLLGMSLAAAMAPATSSMAHAEDLRFDLANNTSVALVELFMSPTDVDNWEEDVLGSEVLMPGETAAVTVADGRRNCVYDILGVFADDDEVEDYGIDLCELAAYEFYEK
tara:strand:+ start:1221 stop:1553 length:333 start_codon:yes stop_codon:yes gene_type:complete